MSDYTPGDCTYYKLNCDRPPVSDETGHLIPDEDYKVGEEFYVRCGTRLWRCVDSSDVSNLKFVEQF